MKENSGSAILCKGCWDQIKAPVPIRGPFSIPLRIFGITQSKMNPNICTMCERAFRRVKKRAHFSQDATILFSDIRGYTQLSETIDPLELSDIVSAFQDQCAHSIWAQDGIVNKQMGDGLMAIFNFPIKAEDHTGRAIDAAFDIQRRCGRNLSQLAGRLALLAGELGIGVGIHSGAVEIGEFGKERSGFTAIGGGVNLAARLESSARAGEIILSPDAAARVPGKLDRAEQRLLDLKGISEPVTAYILRGE